jgi:phospholipid/cholesterol/gamma-HCH transport system ATP-binding protein
MEPEEMIEAGTWSAAGGAEQGSWGSTDAGEAVAALREALAAALEGDELLVSRLARARVSVRFTVGEGGDGLTLLLDRFPPVVLASGEPAEVEVSLAVEQAWLMAQGRLPLPAALVGGAVQAHGPVRRYLEVDPILRRLLVDAAGGEGGRVVGVGGTVGVAPAAELLAIETRGVYKRFGAHQVLAGVDLAIPEGVISVVLGPSGTGKSVLLQQLIGLMKPDRGEVLVRGTPLTGMSRSRLLELRREIGVMFQDGALFSAMSIFDNVAFPLREHTDMEDDEIHELVMERLREVGLEHAARQVPSELSGGMKKRAGLARALILDPGIVLCDEPDSGLDPVRTALLADLLREQHEKGGGMMMIVTHDIALAKRLADHISILWQGRIVEAGMAEQIFASENPFVHQFLAGEIHGPLSME